MSTHASQMVQGMLALLRNCPEVSGIIVTRIQCLERFMSKID